jgi:hypothetical protein
VVHLYPQKNQLILVMLCYVKYMYQPETEQKRICPLFRARDYDLPDIYPSHKHFLNCKVGRNLPLTDDVMRLEMKH